jgi:CubicO group peptidase (beta-lactamase class C family)
LRFNFEQSSRLTPDRGFIFDFVIRQIRASLKRSALSRSNSSGVSLANWLSVRFNFIVESSRAVSQQVAAAQRNGSFFT